MTNAWNKPAVRKAAAIAILVAAVLTQVFFKNIPWPLDIESTDKLRNPSAELATREFVLKDAEVMRNHELLSYDGNAWAAADMDFEAAELVRPPATLLALSKDGAPPTRSGQWHYVTFEDESGSGGEPCRTFIHVKVENSEGGPGEFHLYQLGEPGSNHSRKIEIKADSNRLVVDANTSPPNPTKRKAPGCSKTLQMGEWQTRLQNVPVSFTVPPNAALRITFVSESPNPPSWAGSGNEFKSAQLGPVLARELTLRAIQEDGSPMKVPPTLHLSAFRNSPMKIKDLALGSEDVKIDVSGKAWAAANGNRLGFDLLDAALRNPTTGAILTATNAVLLAFLRKLFIGNSK